MSLIASSTSTISAIAQFLAELQAYCPGLTSVWMLGARAVGTAAHGPAPAIWDLLAFADTLSLQRLRDARHLHRPDVRLRIVTDGDRFDLAWGEPCAAGSLSQWDWAQANDREAFYSQARWAEPAHARLVERTRYRALCLWKSNETMKEPL